MGVAAIILAAGESRRLGCPKQLLPFRGKTLLTHAVHTAATSKCSNVVVVIGANAEQFRSEIQSSATVIQNDRWREGMASSIRAGIAAVESLCEAVIVMLCDQPLVTPEILNSFIANARSGLVAAEYNKTIGVPALFGRSFFPELLALSGKDGAKQILLLHIHQVKRIPCQEAAVDIDSAHDYERLRALE